MQIEVLGERYELREPIGRGGMATIYRGRDTRMDRTVAIKVLREVYSTDPKFVTRFQREAKAASALQHPNIVQVYDYGQTDGNYFIVMELVEGTDLRRYLRSRGVLDIDRAIIIAHDVALGLSAAHRRSIVHRDVKPQNILVGKGGSIKLTDFGIASVYKDINAERLTTTGMTLGTVQYYAPEQAQGEIVSPSADVYALGIVMYEMLTGRTPFDGDTPVAVAMQHIQDIPVPPSELNPGIPPALEEIILRCLEKIPEMRFRDGSQLARALEGLGEADASELGTNQFLVQGPPPAPITFGNIPARPGASGRTNAAPPPVPVQQASSPMRGLADAPTLTPGFSNASPPPGHSSQFDRQVSGGQQAYVPGAFQQIPDTGSTRPFRAGTQQNVVGGRIATVIVVLILIACLLLLGFSVYLAASLGFINLPGVNGAVPTVSTQMGIVPNLVGDSWVQAQLAASTAGFRLHSNDNSELGAVQSQNPQANQSMTKGQTIDVQMGVATQNVQVPPNLVTQPLATVEQLLQTAGLRYTIKSDGQSSSAQPNTVKRVNPTSGTTVKAGSTVTIYVVNYVNGTPTATPSPSPASSPSPSPNPTATATATAGTTPATTPSVTPGTTPGPTSTTQP
ncbi:MAG TPA: protein kinase [Ktedonobacteraceae bacterium]